METTIRNWKSATALILVAVMAFAFYAPSLRFGFFNDDPTGHFRWMEGRSAWSLLTDASGHSYYRPFSFILWQILHSLLGRHDPIVLHLLNVLAHAANAALVTWLAYRLSGRLEFRHSEHSEESPSRVAETLRFAQGDTRLVYATLAGLLFALYPFSYEAVPYVGSFVHPLGTLLILLTLASYLRWRRGNERGAFTAAHVMLTLAVLTQENAVITPLLLLALNTLDLPSTPSYKPTPDQPGSKVLFMGRSFFRQNSLGNRTLTFFIEPAAFAIIWLLVPKTPEVRTPSFEAMCANVLPFVQALVYPVAPLANHNAGALAILAVLSLAVLIALAWRAHLARLLSFGWLIWILASLPSILILDNNYVLGSPRLFYLASVGVALTCALPALALEHILRFETPAPAHSAGVWYLRLGVVVSTLALCILPSLRYICCQLAYQGMAGQVGRMMADAARSAPPGQDVTFVNLPYFFSSRGPGTECRNPFVFAPTGAVVIPPYADAHDFVFYSGGPDRPTLALTVREYQPGWQTFGAPVSVEQLRLRLGSSRVFVFDLVQWRVFDLSAAWQPDAPASQARATIGGMKVPNIEYQISNDQVVVSLAWQATEAMRDAKVFAHIYDGDGRLVAQDDALPADGFVPAAWWQPGDAITDTRSVALDGLRAGTYRVTAGMYDAVTHTRLEARDAFGARLPDDEIVVAQMTR